MFCPLSLSYGQILNIDEFLERCPTNDPIYDQIRDDFEIRRHERLIGSIACSEPISSIPISEYTTVLVVLQTLRTIYYMDNGRSGHLPWTGGTFYDWMKSRIDGINILQESANPGFNRIGDKLFLNIPARDNNNRNSAREWRGISGNIGFYAHEIRHLDGLGHVNGSCPQCPFPNQCDQDYDEARLSTFGTQWWLNKAWLAGGINVGVACLSENRVDEIASFHLNHANFTWRRRFCGNQPPWLEIPDNPGGECSDGSSIEQFTLQQNYPNPFNEVTIFSFELPQPSYVTLKVYDLLGQEVAVPVLANFPAGRFEATWEAKGFSSGVYVYRLQTGTFSETRKLLLLK